jgi:hypothetical protein
MFDNDMHYLQVSDRFLTDYRLEGQDIIGKWHYDVFFPIFRTLEGSSSQNL